MSRFRHAAPPAKKGGGWTWIIIAAAVAYYIFSEEGNPPTPPPPSPAEVAPPATPRAGYALEAARNTWPPVREQDKAATDTEGRVPGATPKDLLAANYYLVLDGSGSMSERHCAEGRTKHEAAIEALTAFARSVPVEANFGLGLFNGGEIRELIPLGPNQNKTLDALNSITPGGSTPLYSAIRFAYGQLTRQAERQQGYGEYHLVVVTDGMASQGQDPTPIVRTLFAESPLVLHTIGFCIGEDHPLNRPGESYYRSANNPAELAQGLETVLAESPAFDLTQFRQQP
ncbi:MAG: VWA domain-containing protein [Gammaproteobacteria bacterium]|nr:VWA domain-containing protein [Gammaproteobacteria bacterium]MBU1654053.1 VWA domain-containing protein [Gammaproteobacteria bacterium]MBU1961737.1 VWA domain-containing protein [Gammaproteobacteria bacterium]